LAIVEEGDGSNVILVPLQVASWFSVVKIPEEESMVVAAGKCALPGAIDGERGNGRIVGSEDGHGTAGGVPEAKKGFITTA
jgi:hypothetical protein